MSETLRLAQHVSDTRYEDLPAAAIHAFKRALQDHVTCAIAGSAMPVSRALLDYFRETDAARVSGPLTGDRSRPAEAFCGCLQRRAGARITQVLQPELERIHFHLVSELVDVHFTRKVIGC